MNISRYLTEDMIKMEMETSIDPPDDGNSLGKWRLNAKHQVLTELVDLLNKGARVSNTSKLLLDFFNREKQASTSIGHGVAVPHIRSLQAKDFIIAVARSSTGYDFGAIDDMPVHLFFVMAAPPYDDTLYLRVFRSLAEKLQYESFREELMTASSAGEVMRAIRAAE
jgi:PTS system fructose-specific IIC component